MNSIDKEALKLKNNYMGQLYFTSITIDLGEIRKNAQKEAMKLHPELKEKDRALIDSIALKTKRMLNLVIQNYVQKIKNNPSQYGLPEIKLNFTEYRMTSKVVLPLSQDGKVEYTLYFYEDKSKKTDKINREER